jgi:hypothetical protein
MKKYLIPLLLFSFTAFASVIYYGSGEAVLLENRLKFKNKVTTESGTVTPTAGLSRATGSVYQKTDGTFWVKQYGATTSWARVATSSEIPAAITSLTGEVTATGPGASIATVSNSAVIGKVLTGYTAGAGTVSATDSILEAIQKLGGNDGLYVLKAGDTMTGDLVLPTARASSSSGLLLEANGGTDVALLGAGGGSNATFYGGTTVNGQLKADGGADQAHLVVEGHSTQTANLVEIYNNTPTYLAGFDANGHLRMRDASASSAANPQLYFITGANKSGIGYNSAGVNSELFFVTNGSSRAGVSVAGFSVLVPIIGNGNGASSPAIRPASADGNTGIAWNGADDFCASAGGTCRMSFASALNTSSVPLQISAQNELRLADSDSSNYVALKSAATVSTNFTWTLPSAVCSSGQSVRFSDASGTMECYTPSSSTTKVYSAKISTNGVVSDEIGGDFINGNCTDASPSVCTFNGSIATSAINCLASPVTTSSFFGTVDTNSGTSTVSVRIRDDAGAAEKRPFNLLCHAD